MVENAEEPEDITAEALRASVDAAVTDRVAMLRADLMAELGATEADRIARLDHRLAQTVATIVEIIETTRRESVERAPVEVDALRTELNAALVALDSRFSAVEAVQVVAGVPDDDLAARLTAVEQEVREGLARLNESVRAVEAETLLPTDAEDMVRAQAEAAVAEQIAAVRNAAVAGGDSTDARIDGLEREISERLSELAEQLSAVQAVAADEAEALITMVGSDLTQRLDRLAAQVAGVTGSADSTDAALTRLDREIVHLSESVKADRAASATQMSELEDRVRGMVSRTGPAAAPAPPTGGGRKKVRGADVERLVESVEAWRAQSVGEEEFFALRAELETMVARRIASAQADVQHRLEVLEAVLGDAGGDDDTDIRALRAEVASLTAAVAKVQKAPRAPAKARKKSPDPG